MATSFHMLSTSLFAIIQSLQVLITVVMWSQAQTVFAHSNAGIVGLNPTQDMDI
jgi:hypothetical protein